jgi:hypothetical protein
VTSLDRDGAALGRGEEEPDPFPAGDLAAAVHVEVRADWFAAETPDDERLLRSAVDLCAWGPLRRRREGRLQRHELRARPGTMGQRSADGRASERVGPLRRVAVSVRPDGDLERCRREGVATMRLIALEDAESGCEDKAVRAAPAADGGGRSGAVVAVSAPGLPGTQRWLRLSVTNAPSLAAQPPPPPSGSAPAAATSTRAFSLSPAA